MPLIQPMRLPAGTSRPDPARPAAHCPVPTQDAIGDGSSQQNWTWRAHSTHSGATSWHNNGDPATVPNRRVRARLSLVAFTVRGYLFAGAGVSTLAKAILTVTSRW